MLKFWDHHGILGINARNLLYIKPYNKKSGIKFADDKLKTKQYLSARGIKVPRLIAKISTENELKNFSFSSLPNSFVLKPNGGFGGGGIIVTFSRDELGWRDSRGGLITEEDLFEHISDIIDGRFSISGSRDTAFFEQRLASHSDMGVAGKYGLPDIRVIVYNMVPVMAMLRVPTEESGGKANMMLGGIGAGIDLAKGEVTHLAKYNRILKPGTEWDKMRGMKLPMWEQVLLMATKIQSLVTLGYLAVDVVVDQVQGPTLLEINARAGLKVQVSNLAPLRDRLDRVSGVKVKTAEKGVRMAQDLFGNKIERKVEHLTGKQVIGLEEPITLNLKHGRKELTAKINPNAQKSYLEKGLFDTISMFRTKKEKTDKLTLNYTLSGVRGKTIFYPIEMQGKDYQVVIGPNVLKGFLVDITHKATTGGIPADTVGTDVSPAPVVLEADRMLQKADALLAQLDRKIVMVSALRPRNIDSEQKRFFSQAGYEPRFEYPEAPEGLEDMRTSLLTLELDGSSLGILLDMKKQELLRKLTLLEAIGDDDAFPSAARDLWGEPPQEIIDLAKNHLRDLGKPQTYKKPFSDLDAMERFKTALEVHGLSHWEVKLKQGVIARCTIGKHNRLLIKKGEMFSAMDVEKLVAHEIETHIFCSENGKLQPYQIFQRGFSNYLKTQEGLAVYNQVLATGDKSRNATVGILAVEWGKAIGFSELFNRLLDHLDRGEAWRMAVKVKRGLGDTGKPGAFYKNALYFWGWKEVESYLDQGGDYEDLYMGKIALEHLELIKKLDGLVKSRLVRER